MHGSGSCVFAVWSYVIAHTKPDAMVELNPVAIACVIGDDVRTIERALEQFKSPDPKSRSKEFEGRRLIQKGEFIYFVPQYHKYHGFANDRERREYFAQKKREQRERDKNCQTVMSKVSKNVQQSEAESEAKTNTKKKRKPISFQELLDFAKTIHVSEFDAQAFFNSQESGGWTRGGKPLHDWQASLRTWKDNGWLVSQKNKSHEPQPYKQQGEENMKRLYNPPIPDLTPEQIKKNKEFASEMVRKVKRGSLH